MDRGSRANVRSWLNTHPAAASTIVLLFSTMVVLFVILLSTTSFTIDVGAAGDGIFIRNFFPPEQTPDGATFRWSEPNAQLLLPDAGLPQILGMRVHTDASRILHSGACNLQSPQDGC